MTSPTTGNHADNSASNVGSISTTLTVTASATAVIAFLPLFGGTGENVDVASVVLDPGGGDESAFTFVDSNQSTISGVERVECWILTDPPSGTFTITATAVEASISRFFLSTTELFDVDTTAPTGATAGASGFSITASVDVTTTAAESLVMAGIIHRRGNNLTPGTDVVELMDRVQTGITGWSGYKDAPTIGTYTVDASPDSDDAWNALGVEVLAVAAAAERRPEMVRPVMQPRPIRQLRI